jgi:hypothetical protein
MQSNDNTSTTNRITTLVNSPSGRSFQILNGSALCEVRVWTEAEWAALPIAQRPPLHTHAPMLGWVGAAPTLSMN